LPARPCLPIRTPSLVTVARLLDRLQPANAPGLSLGVYRWAQDVCEQIEAVFEDQQSQITAIAAAQASAAAAQATADTVNKLNKISASSMEPGDVLTGEDAGANARIVIANHVRRYDDGSGVNITGTTLTGLPYSEKRFVYYDDPTLSDTTPSFQTTTNASIARPNKATGRHYVGGVETPGPGGGPTSGGGTAPGGGSEPIDYR
jgi:hypothetical protein